MARSGDPHGRGAIGPARAPPPGARTERPASSRARLGLLGTFRVSVDGEAVDVPFQAQRVLACLAVGGSMQPRSVVAGQLWGASAEDRALATLRNTVWRIRQISGALITATREALGLAPCLAVDLEEARRCAGRLVGHDHPVEHGEQAIVVLDHDLLPTWDEEWLTIERERVRQLRIHALEVLSARLLRQGEYSWAIQAALAAVSAEPLRESAQATVIRAHLAEGNPYEAIRQFEAYSKLLADELDLDPSPQLRTLVGGIAGGRPSVGRSRA